MAMACTWSCSPPTRSTGLVTTSSMAGARRRRAACTSRRCRGARQARDDDHRGSGGGAAARRQLDARQAQEHLRQSRDDARSRRVEQQAKRDADRATVRRVADQWVDASESGWTLDHVSVIAPGETSGKAEELGVRSDVFFMWASGEQLAPIGALVELGVIRPWSIEFFPWMTSNRHWTSASPGGPREKIVIKAN